VDDAWPSRIEAMNIQNEPTAYASRRYAPFTRSFSVG
jgi:hypothetical protein